MTDCAVKLIHPALSGYIRCQYRDTVTFRHSKIAKLQLTPTWSSIVVNDDLICQHAENDNYLNSSEVNIQTFIRRQTVAYVLFVRTLPGPTVICGENLDQLGFLRRLKSAHSHGFSVCYQSGGDILASTGTNKQ